MRAAVLRRNSQRCQQAGPLAIVFAERFAYGSLAKHRIDRGNPMMLSASTRGLEPTSGALRGVRAVLAMRALAAASPVLYAQQLTWVL